MFRCHQRVMMLRVLLLQRLMLFGLPLTLSWWLSDPAYCHAPEVPVPPPSVAPPKRNSLILRAIDAVRQCF